MKMRVVMYFLLAAAVAAAVIAVSCDARARAEDGEIRVELTVYDALYSGFDGQLIVMLIDATPGSEDVYIYTLTERNYVDGVAMYDMLPANKVYAVSYEFLPCEALCDACKDTYVITDDISVLSVEGKDISLIWEFMTVNDVIEGTQAAGSAVIFDIDESGTVTIDDKLITGGQLFIDLYDAIKHTSSPDYAELYADYADDGSMAEIFAKYRLGKKDKETWAAFNNVDRFFIVEGYYDIMDYYYRFYTLHDTSGSLIDRSRMMRAISQEAEDAYIAFMQWQAAIHSEYGAAHNFQAVSGKLVSAEDAVRNICERYGLTYDYMDLGGSLGLPVEDVNEMVRMEGTSDKPARAEVAADDNADDDELIIAREPLEEKSSYAGLWISISVLALAGGAYLFVHYRNKILGITKNKLD